MTASAWIGWLVVVLTGDLCAQEPLHVALVKMPYSGARNVAELSANPDYLEAGGLVSMLAKDGYQLSPITNIELSAAQEGDYGVWHRLGMANGHLGRQVAADQKAGYLSIGLLANCSAVSGMLAGLQHSGPDRRPLRVGLVFIDAHGDFNTPETTLSGMLGGMPVAVAAGMCLTRLRQESGLDPALPTNYIVMAGVRDTDPLEQELIDRAEIAQITVDDIRSLSPQITTQMQRLSKLTDRIYVHIDMDVLDPREVPGHPLTVADGPTSKELAAAVKLMFGFPKVTAFGIASTPSGDRDPDGISLEAAYTLIRGALEGARERDR